jgi:uridine monophosphate synthetase
MRRKEVKDYGTKKAIEGAYTRGERCLIVEDLVTSGASVAETVAPLNEAGLLCSDVVVLIDREQGAEAHLNKQNLRLHAAFKLTYLLDVLVRHGKVDQATADRVRAFLAANQTAAAVAGAGAVGGAAAATAAAAGAATAAAAASKPSTTPTPTAPRRLPYEQRAKLAPCAMAKRCLELMARKKTNLSVAADVATADEMLALADAVGPHVCVFKTHVDIFDKWDASIAAKLTALAEKHDFLIFEDRKFADIGNTVVSQYSGGVYRIADWSHLTNAHLVPGPGIIDGLKQVGLPKGRGLLLLAEMSSKGTLAKGDYTRAVAEAAAASPEFVMGFISVNPASWPEGLGSKNPGMIHMTPGVQLAAGGDALGQQYLTPARVIGAHGSDVIIVGRGVIKAADPAKAAAEYREAGWAAYEASLKA